MKKKLKWYIVNKEYVSYLQKFDAKVENADYEAKLKPYIGVLIEINEMNYYVPVSSVKQKHYKMKEDIDFIKIVRNGEIMGVLNINNMIPIINQSVKVLQYKKIEKYRQFANNREKKAYIALLDIELNLINEKADKIRKNAVKLYKEKINHPNSRVSKRCCDFKYLEEKSKIFK